MDIFEIYTKRAVENVQDGISRPLGSPEIQEIKGATVLRYTLYNGLFRTVLEYNVVNYSKFDFVLQ